MVPCRWLNYALWTLALLVALDTGIPARAATLTFTLQNQPEILVLLFHQVSDHPIESASGSEGIARPWVTPAQFARILADLQHDGYHAITLRQALSYLEGFTPASTLPPKPLLITFDDGYASAWTEATQILQRVGATATMFFEGHAVDNPAMPGRLSSQDLRAMAHSPAWTLESHGFAGHSNLTISATGSQTPYWYANLAWLPAQQRLETPAQFEARVEGDLRAMRTQFEPLLGTKMTVFAYPSGEFGQNASLPAGADPRTRIEAGHSNADGLTPLLATALQHAGYEAAFAVSLPASAHLTRRHDSIWTLPRIGVGEGFDETTLRSLPSLGDEYPETAEGHFADVGPICVGGKRLYAASTNRPVIFALDTLARLRARYDFDALVSDRPDRVASISALSCSATDLFAVQQAGFDPHPQAYLDRFRLVDGVPTLQEHTRLPTNMNWLVGIAPLEGSLYGIDDRGAIFDLNRLIRVGAIAGPAQQNEFAGLTSDARGLYTFDRLHHEVVSVTPSGAVLARGAIDADIHDLAFDGSRAFVSVWSSNRHVLRIYLMEEGP